VEETAACSRKIDFIVFCWVVVLWPSFASLIIIIKRGLCKDLGVARAANQEILELNVLVGGWLAG
jgi:hypothetical protein